MKNLIVISVLSIVFASCSKQQNSPTESENVPDTKSVVFGQEVNDSVFFFHFDPFPVQDTVDIASFRSSTNIAVRVTEEGIPYSDSLLAIAQQTVIRVQTLNDQETLKVNETCRLLGAGWSSPGDRYVRVIIMPMSLGATPAANNGTIELATTTDAVQILIHSDFSGKAITGTLFLKKSQ
jgi:hypothetical protein